MSLSGVALCQTATYTFDIPAESLASALQDVAKVSGKQIIFSAQLTAGMSTTGLRGTYTVNGAMSRLLVGTGLGISEEKSGGIIVSAKRIEAAESEEAENFGGSNPARTADSAGLEEVVVTAQKREERLQDVPMSVTALVEADLGKYNQNRLQDFYTSVPGLTYTGAQQGGGSQVLVVRGITTGYGGAPTVATTIDGVPYGSASFYGGGQMFSPDIDPNDLARIEVLKGPQGTLYGASALGGLLNYVTKDPSTSAFSGRVAATGQTVQDGGSGYGLSGSVNIPIASTVAIRASAFSREDPGFVKDITTGQENVNSVRFYGGRLSTLWLPSDVLSFKFDAMYQRADGNGAPYVDATADSRPRLKLPDLEQTGIRGHDTYNDESQFYLLTIKARPLGVDVTSTTSYSRNSANDFNDYSAAWGPIPNQLMLATGVFGATAPLYYVTRKETEELKASSQVWGRLDWTVGGFYDHEHTSLFEHVTYNEPNTGAPLGLLADFDDRYTLTEYAAYADFTQHVTDKFKIQIGGRYSSIAQSTTTLIVGPATPVFTGGSPSGTVSNAPNASRNAFTYLISPQYSLSKDVMAYVRVATGYRAGGNNTGPGAAIKPTFGPDSITNYEVGLKSSFLQEHLIVDASVYHIAWRRIQLAFTAVDIGYEGNGGGAKSDGLELSVQARPVEALSISAVASYDNAVLTEDLPASDGYGPAGSRLPWSAQVSGRVAIDYDFYRRSNLTAFAGAAASYVGPREMYFSTPRWSVPAYTQTDLHLGVRSGPWTGNLFIDNAANERGYTGATNAFTLGNPFGVNLTVIQPRTFGLSVSRNF